MSESIRESISRNICKFRKQSGLSQKELAEKIGAKNLTTVSSWERGISSPDADTIIKLCQLFGVSLYDLYDIESREELTFHEKRQIEKYRYLSDSGKEMVDIVLDKEYERACANHSKEEKPMNRYKYTVAARGNGQLENEFETEMTLEDIAKAAKETALKKPDTTLF